MISYNHPSGTAARHTHITYLSTSHILIHSHAPSACTTAGYLQSRRGMRRRGQVVPPLLPIPTSLYTLTHTHTHSLSLLHSISLTHTTGQLQSRGGMRRQGQVVPLPPSLTHPPTTLILTIPFTHTTTNSWLSAKPWRNATVGPSSVPTPGSAPMVGEEFPWCWVMGKCGRKRDVICRSSTAACPRRPCRRRLSEGWIGPRG